MVSLLFNNLINKNKSGVLLPLLFFTFTFFIASCNAKSNLYSYTNKYLPINSIFTNEGGKSTLIIKNDQRYLLVYSKTHFLIIDVKKDSIIRVLPFQDSTISISSFSASDTNSFALLTSDLVFYVYEKGSFKKIYYNSDTDGHTIFNPTYIQYFPDQKIIVANVLRNDGKQFPKKEHFNWEVFKIYRTDIDSSYIIPFNYPNCFHGGVIGNPHTYTSKVGKYLIVSFDYDEYVYKIDVTNNTVEKKKVISQFNQLNPPQISDLKGKELKDKLLKNGVFYDRYGVAFWDTNDNRVTRIYYPLQPEKKPNGSFFSSFDKPCNIVIKKGNKRFEYMMPSGVFYMPQDWFYDYKAKVLSHKKILPYERSKKVWNYYIIDVELFEHQL
jgi:hypothetical protein